MPLFDVFWAMLGLFLFFIWIWLLITLFADIFGNKDMSGGVKALWVLFLILLPLLGALVYLIANGTDMHERQAKAVAAQEAAAKRYIQEAAGTGSSTADEIAKLKQLHDSGALTDAEFAAQKAKGLS
jgi:hypothetical protein